MWYNKSTSRKPQKFKILTILSISCFFLYVSVLHFYSFLCHSRKRSRRSDSCNTLHRFCSFGCHASSQSIEKTSITFQVSNVRTSAFCFCLCLSPVNVFLLFLKCSSFHWSHDWSFPSFVLYIMPQQSVSVYFHLIDWLELSLFGSLMHIRCLIKCINEIFFKSDLKPTHMHALLLWSIT